MLHGWDREEGSGLGPPPPPPFLNTSSVTNVTRGLAAPAPPSAQSATNPPLESSASIAGSGSGGGASVGAARGCQKAKNSRLADASRPQAPCGDRGGSNKINSKNCSGRSSSGVCSSASSKNHVNGTSHGAAAAGLDHLAILPREFPRNNISSVGGSSSNKTLHGVSSVNLETHCFPPPLPRPALGVVQEARAFAPSQHLAVLQALLNGEQGQGDTDFDTDSDSEKEEETDSGGAAQGEGKQGIGSGL